MVIDAIYFSVILCLA